MPAFRLYGLMGCGHCVEATRFLRQHNVPLELIVANEDPLIQAGVQSLTHQDGYPILLYRPLREVLTGFPNEAYERVLEHYLAGSRPEPTGPPDPSELPDGPLEAPPSSAPTGA